MIMTETNLYPVPHRHFTFSIPKILHTYFFFDRSLRDRPASHIPHNILHDFAASHSSPGLPPKNNFLSNYFVSWLNPRILEIAVPMAHFTALFVVESKTPTMNSRFSPSVAFDSILTN